MYSVVTKICIYFCNFLLFAVFIYSCTCFLYKSIQIQKLCVHESVRNVNWYVNMRSFFIFILCALITDTQLFWYFSLKLKFVWELYAICFNFFLFKGSWRYVQIVCFSEYSLLLLTKHFISKVRQINSELQLASG